MMQKTAKMLALLSGKVRGGWLSQEMSGQDRKCNVQSLSKAGSWCESNNREQKMFKVWCRDKTQGGVRS